MRAPCYLEVPIRTIVVIVIRLYPADSMYLTSGCQLSTNLHRTNLGESGAPWYGSRVERFAVKRFTEGCRVSGFEVRGLPVEASVLALSF